MKYLLLLGRVLFSAIFIASSMMHFTQADIQYATENHVPYPEILVPLSGVIALLGGLSVLFGYKARLGAWLLILFLVPVTYYMHAFWNFDVPGEIAMQQAMFMKNLSMIGTCLIIGYFGSGPLSVGGGCSTCK